MEKENVMLRILALLAILAHLLVAMVHGAAHRVLHIGLSGIQTLFILVVITAAPIVAGVLLWRNSIRAGARLLMLSMIGSLIFGFWNHYIAVSSDHISQVAFLPNRQWAMLFQVTAVLLALLEVFATAVALRILFAPTTTVP
jgi:hypothetical protein